ncbi:hypothetical protein PQX77_010717 [Marasmius sp. AFHP31]|nr:hypothetical protein PQX77_010717 [Marasmius sp. AFHP31]
MAETAQGIKSKGKGLSKTHEHAVDPPILTRGGFSQRIAVVIFPFSSGVTTFHPHDTYTSKTRRDARISKAYMGRQLEYAESTGHLVELDVYVKDTAKDNLYPSIYTIVAANCNSRGFLFGDAPLPVEPPSSPPFLPLKIIRMSCGDALLGPSGLDNKWSLNELNRQTADHSIGLNHKKRLVVICAPTCIMTGSVAGLRDGLEEGIHGCYGYRWNHAFMNTKYVPDGEQNVIDCFSYCPGEEEEEEQEQQDDTSAQVTSTSARRERSPSVFARQVRPRVSSSDHFTFSQASTAAGHSATPLHSLSSDSSLPPTAFPSNDHVDLTSPRPLASFPPLSAGSSRSRSGSIDVVQNIINAPSRSVSPVLVGINQAAQSDSSRWIREVRRNLAGAYEPDYPAIVIEAGAAVDAAKALIHCIEQHHRGKVLDLPLVLGTATVKAFDFERLLCGWRSLKVEAGVGEGPTERVLRACMDHLIEEYADFFKETAGDLFTWAFSPGGASSPDQLVLAKVL